MFLGTVQRLVSQGSVKIRRKQWRDQHGDPRAELEVLGDRSRSGWIGTRVAAVDLVNRNPLPRRCWCEPQLVLLALLKMSVDDEVEATESLHVSASARI